LIVRTHANSKPAVAGEQSAQLKRLPWSRKAQSD
jgi:hypothetical protein